MIGRLSGSRQLSLADCLELSRSLSPVAKRAPGQGGHVLGACSCLIALSSLIPLANTRLLDQAQRRSNSEARVARRKLAILPRLPRRKRDKAQYTCEQRHWSVSNGERGEDEHSPPRNWDNGQWRRNLIDRQKGIWNDQSHGWRMRRDFLCGGYCKFFWAQRLVGPSLVE